MKRLLILAAALVCVASTVAMAAPGDVFVLPLLQSNLQGGGWTTYSGAGYGGADAYGASTMDGVRRAIWKMPASAPSSTELYTIEFFRPTAGAANWQPIESQISGGAGEVFPVDPNIPWIGMWGTNHQYIGAENGTAGQWTATGPGPHTPESASPAAGANGIYMWLNNSSWLYAKWDYGWAIDHTWSAIRVTQITGTVPEPGSMLALGGGLLSMIGLVARKRK